jgi:hypothetical protein
MNKTNFANIPKVVNPIKATPTLLSNIRKRRELECFPYVNRGRLWYALLSDKQLIELTNWYHAWLDATETLVVPAKLEWLDGKLDTEELL